MKRSHVVMLLAGGATWAAITAYGEHSDCRPDAGAQPAHCSSSGGGGGHSGSGSSSESSSTSRGGFGGTGAAHGGGGE